MLFVFFVLLLSENAVCSEFETLSCFTTEKVVYDVFPKFVIEEETTATVNFTEKDELTIGRPVCVMFFGYNRTHSTIWQGHVSSFSLPLQCHIDSYIGSGSSTHCFSSPNKFLFLELSSGWSCCCSTNNCNMHNPYFFEIYEKLAHGRSPLLDRLKPLCKFFACIILILCGVAIETVIETYISIWLGAKQKVRGEVQRAESTKVAVESVSPGDVLKSPMVLRTLSVKATQPSQKSSNNLSEISMKPIETLTVEKTQEDEVDLLPLSTQSDSLEKVPIPPKPELKMLPSGRMQRTSMNYDESTYSDLQ